MKTVKPKMERIYSADVDTLVQDYLHGSRSAESKEELREKLFIVFRDAEVDKYQDSIVGVSKSSLKRRKIAWEKKVRSGALDKEARKQAKAIINQLIEDEDKERVNALNVMLNIINDEHTNAIDEIVSRYNAMPQIDEHLLAQARDEVRSAYSVREINIGLTVGRYPEPVDEAQIAKAISRIKETA